MGELEQLKQNIRHFTIEVSVLTNIFYFTTEINEIIPFLFAFARQLPYVLTFGFTHSFREFYIF